MRRAPLNQLLLSITCIASTCIAETLSDEASYAQARQLIEQHQPHAASFELGKIPQDSELYPSAAKALLYCAHISPELSLELIAHKLSKSKQPEIVRLAKAAWLENLLEQNKEGELARRLYEQLKKENKQDQISALLPLFDIDILRLEQKFESALNRSTELAKSDLSDQLKQLLRLKTAKLYYDIAAWQKEQDRAKAMGEVHQTIDSPLLLENAEGKGEETLLQFISSYPDSKLIDEALRLLHCHQAFPTSAYAIEQLKEWGEVSQQNKPRRAALALLYLHSLEPEERSERSHSNTAMAIAPQERASKELALDTSRRLFNQGDISGAEQYIKLSESDSALALFLHGAICAKQGDYLKAASYFERCSQQSEGALQDAAIHNLLLCSLRRGDNKLAQSIITQSKGSPLHAKLLSCRSAFRLNQSPRPANAKEDALELIHRYPDSPLVPELEMDLIEMELDSSIKDAYTRQLELNKINRHGWSSDSLARYYALRLKLAPLAFQAELPDSVKPTIEAARCLSECSSREQSDILSLHLGNMLIEKHKFGEASKLFKQLAQDSNSDETKALAYFHAGLSTERLVSLSSIMQAIGLYRDCSNYPGELQASALIRAAGLLTRIGREEDARLIMEQLLRQQEDKKLSPEQLSLAYTTLAESWALSRGDQTAAERNALHYSSLMCNDERLKKEWRSRTRLLFARLNSRYGKHSTSLECFLDIIRDIKDSKDKLNNGDWHILNIATAGAINQHLKLKQYEKAADLADKIAQHNAKLGDTNQAQQHQRSFRSWANHIRKTGFVTKKPSPRSQSNSQ